jgi:uncharacterized protein (TIGR02444 family)
LPVTDDEADLWQFAVRLYGGEGVADACLRLQDGHGVDIPLLLFAAWLAEKGVTLSPQRATEARDWVRAWQQEVVSTLRALRRRLKNAVSLAPPELAEGVRASIKRAELESEKVELAWLVRNSAAWLEAPAAPVDPMVNLNLMFAVMTGSEEQPGLQDLCVIAACLGRAAP